MAHIEDIGNVDCPRTITGRISTDQLTAPYAPFRYSGVQIERPPKASNYSGSPCLKVDFSELELRVLAAVPLKCSGRTSREIYQDFMKAEERS
jgi:hypothetical protein